MFISIPKEFFVPVVFGEGFRFNQDNNHLEIELDNYRESTGKSKASEKVDISKNKAYLDNSKSAKEKQDIIEVKMTESKKGEITTKKESTNYITLKSNEDIEKLCNDCSKIFSELDDEFINSIEIKGCSDK